MNITPLNAINFYTQVSTAVLNLNMDAIEAAGEGLVKMIDETPKAAMERSVNPNVGANLDITI